MPIILLQRGEETFPAVTERMNCTNSEDALVGLYGETYPAPHDADQAMNVRAEAVSDAEEEEDPAPITFPEINAEPEGNLIELQPVHVEERQYSSDECGESLSQEQILIAHRHIHSGDQSFCSGVCNKTFSQQNHLKKHQCIHGVEKRFCCDICNKSFISKSNLKKQMFIHSGVKQFCCNVCNKSFSEQSLLKRHQCTHSGEKPFCCA
ncbi:zinc finger protein OZF-like, partial [Cryptotermes secundus]|uniref:zinc finger protein OZF-like n=1 Tax=Cryptotermes secundus TaxID=105785 RepID=UPI000CD7B894